MNKSRKSYLILESPNYLKIIISLSIPSIINYFLKSFFEILDIRIINKLSISLFDKNNLISCITFSSFIFILFCSIIEVLSIVFVYLLSHAIGSNDEKRKENIISIFLILSIIGGLIIFILLFLLTPFIVKINNNEIVSTLCLKYLRIKSFEIIPLFIINYYYSLRIANGDTLTPVLLNIIIFILNYTIFYFFNINDNLLRIALSNVISSVIGMITCLIYLYFKKVFKLSLKNDRLMCTEIIKKAYPLLISKLLTNFGFLVINNIILSSSDVLASSIFICNRINNFLMVPINAFTSNLVTLIAHNVGQNNIKRINNFINYIVKMIMVLSICDIILFVSFRKLLISTLISNEQIIDVASNYLIYVLLSLPLSCLFQGLISIFEGYGCTLISMVLSVFRLWGVRIPLSLIINKTTNLNLINMGSSLLISNLLVVIMGVIFYYIKKEGFIYGRNHQKIS